MAHGLVFLPVLLSLVGPAEINVGAKILQSSETMGQSKDDAKDGADGVAMA